LSLASFAQNQEVSRSVTSQEEFLKTKIEFGRTVLEKGGYLDIFSVFQAVRNDDLTLCNSKDLQPLAVDLLALRYVGENRCKKIKNNFYKDMCDTANAQDCDRLNGWHQGFCRAVRSNDPETIAKILKQDDIKKALKLRGPVSLKMVNYALGIAYGFKHYSSIPCERFVRDLKIPLSLKYSCQMLFYPDFQRQVDAITTDLSLFVVARTIPEPDLCLRIQDKELQDICIANEIEHLSAIW